VQPSIAAEVVALFESERRREVFCRMLTAKEAPPDVIAAIEEGLRYGIVNRAPSSEGWQAHARVANILNKLEVDQTDDILEDVTVRVPEQAPKIKALLFSFQDILRLAPTARTTLFDKVPTEKVVLALRGASPELREAVLSSLTARARRMIASELEIGGKAPEAEVKRAMRSISDLALELAGKGEIILPDATSSEEAAA
jgi:flagellar motor switch protein FliG